MGLSQVTVAFMWLSGNRGTIRTSSLNTHQIKMNDSSVMVNFSWRKLAFYELFQ